MRISVDELKAYSRCSLCYKFTYLDEIQSRRSLDDVYDECLKTAISYYYFSMIDNKSKDFDAILRKWESIWFTEWMVKTYGEDVIRDMSNKAVVLLSEFYKKICSEDVIPVAVNFPYEAIFQGKDNIHVKGSIDLIKIINDRKATKETQLVFFTKSRKYLDELVLKGNVFLSVSSYAFRNSFKDKENRIVVNNIACKGDVSTTRSDADFLRAEKIVRNICRGIKASIFYPTSNTYICAKCPYRMYCINERAVNG